MKMEFRVTYDDGRTVDVVAKPKDIVAFERQYGQSMASFANVDNPPPLEWMYYLAWSPLHRSGQDGRSFDEFLDSVAEIASAEEAEPVTPLDPAASAEPSADSQSAPA